MKTPMVQNDDDTNNEGPTDNDNDIIGSRTMGVAGADNSIGDGGSAAASRSADVSLALVVENVVASNDAHSPHIDRVVDTMSINLQTTQRTHMVPGDVGAMTSDSQS